MAAMVNTGAQTDNTASTAATKKSSTAAAAAPKSEGSSSDTEGEDGGNPQQGAPRLANTAVKNESINSNDSDKAIVNSNYPSRMPPSVKDLRKLFVGGLPQDGTYLGSRKKLRYLSHATIDRGTHTFYYLFDNVASLTVTSSEFRAFFEKFGVVDDSVVMVDRETNRSRGFGFVTFQDASVTERVLAMGADTSKKTATSGTSRETATTTPTCFLEMRGKLVEIKAAEPKINPSPRARAFRKGESSSSRGKFQPTVTPGNAYANIPVSAPGAVAYTSYYQHQQQQSQGCHPGYNNPYGFYGTHNSSRTNTTAFEYDATHYYYPYYYNYPQDGVNAGYYYQPHPRQHSVIAGSVTRKATNPMTEADSNDDSRNTNEVPPQS